MGDKILSEEIKNLSESSLIDVIGFTDASEFSNYTLKQSKRRDPKLTLPQTKSIVIAGIYIGGITMPEWDDPWNKRHLENPLNTKMINFFQNKINKFRETFYLQNLCKLSENDYKAVFGKLNTEVPYHIFKRNIAKALENAKRD